MVNIKLFVKYELFPRIVGLTALFLNILYFMSGSTMSNLFLSLCISLFVIDYITGVHDRLHARFGDGKELISYLLTARSTCFEVCIFETITMVPNDSRRVNRLI